MKHLLVAGVIALVTSAANIRIQPARSAMDTQDAQSPAAVHLGGWIGERSSASTANRLSRIDTDRLLEGYRKRPGRQAWDGEHVGKWLHAATLAWIATPDPALKAKLDRTVAGLIACQQPDGYLGTYLEADRWTEWDVWAHKYNLLGLLTYYRATGDEAALACCRKMADLLVRSFGEQPGQRDILKAGHHVGMAPTSVLEPMALLYQATADPRYLAFCTYLVDSWERPEGPHIVSRLLAGEGVHKVGNGKAYEMLSCLCGALELYRVTGDRKLLDAALAAWRDIVDHRLYITGAASACELFRPEFDLPNSNNVGETCVTVTWIQFNAQLLRLVGEARFAEQIEHAVLNQLMGAQRPDGAAWGYYVQMEGKKPYSDTLDGHCCLSSGPRGFAILPTVAVTTDAHGVVINLLEAAKAELALRGGEQVSVRVETEYPASGTVRAVLDLKTPRAFTVKMRVPAWATNVQANPSGGTVSADGYMTWTREWSPGDTAAITFAIGPRVVVGDHSNLGKAAVMYGPLVLAADESRLSGAALATVVLPTTDAGTLGLAPTPVAHGRLDEQSFGVRAATSDGRAVDAALVPFADAGATGSRYRVWIPIAGSAGANLLAGASESRSRSGNQSGSITDDDLDSFVVTWDGTPAEEAWFAAELEAPAKASRFVYTHGRNFHDGGWFDTSKGKPVVQIRRGEGSAWESIGVLDDYPQTTAQKGDADRLTWSNRQFALVLGRPVEFVAVRVIGRPACGDDPRQAFASCAELQAFRE